MQRKREGESQQREWEIFHLLFHSPNACSRQGWAREKPGAASQCGVSLMVAGMEWYESSCPVCHPRHTLARSWNEVHLNLASDRGYGCARWPLNVKCLFHSVLRKNLDQWDLELSRFCNPFQASGHLLCVMNFLQTQKVNHVDLSVNFQILWAVLKEMFIWLLFVLYEYF